MLRKRVLTLALAAAFAISLLAGCGQAPAQETPEQKYQGAASADYAHSVALELIKFTNSELGGRNAGSDAEHKAADYLAAEMKKIGLQEVGKDEYPVVKWQFNGASLQVVSPAGETKTIKPYSYASGATPAEGITGELVYVVKGTKDDYTGKNVKGKIVLIDVDMRADWWVTYPTLEAAHQGAAAIINSCSGGYAELNDDTMNSQDFVGPVTIPSVNISRNDAKYLKDLAGKGPLTVNLKVDNIVDPNGKAYNVLGKIPGKNPEEYIIVGDHYDAHFLGFEDNACAAGLTLAIAKGMIDSGYQPERTMVFVLHSAEEYGAIDTRYDWSIGAWNEINRIHPEWAGKALAYINFELPAYEFASSTHVDSAVELYSLLKDYSATAPKPADCIKEGVKDAGYPQHTWSDDWSYTAAGVPSLVNGFLTDEKGEGYDFYKKIYHSQFDNPDIYNKNVMDFNLKFYGSLALYLDRNPALALDFSQQAQRVKDSVKAEVFKQAGVDPAPLLAAADGLSTVAAEKYAQLSELNRLYGELSKPENAEKNADLLAKMREAGAAADKQVLATFKTAQDGLLRLDWADNPIVGHEQPQNNLLLLNQAVSELKEGKVNDVVDNVLWQVEDEWYSYSFSKEVARHFNDQVMDPANKDNLFWGKGRIVGAVDLYDTVQSLVGKYDSTGSRFTKEIASLNKAADSQKLLLGKLAGEETQALTDTKTQLQQVDLAAIIAEGKKALGEE